VLSIGKAIEYAEEGFDGIINVIPFHCMPGTVVNGVLEKFQKDYSGVPCLKLSFDGQEQTNEETRLEAFMHQAYQRMESRLNARAYGTTRHRGGVSSSVPGHAHSGGKGWRDEHAKKEVFSE
jgi:predicted nucleotide-binding protein (sugar kinase/HSP70/actin superfamily)